jgi:hypothetical protein
MREVRKTVVFVLIAAIWVGAVTSEASNQNPTVRRHERLVVGPLPLGDLFKGAKSEIYHMDAAGGPKEADVLKAMNRCKLWLIDRKELDARTGKWTFSWGEPREGRIPKLLLEGEFAYRLRDQEGNDFHINIEYLGHGDGDIKEPPGKPWQRRITFSVKLATSPFPYKEGGKGAKVKDISAISRSLYWDVNGKTWLDEVKAEKK